MTKPRIVSLLTQGVLKMDLFDAPLAEVIDYGQRYILRRSLERANELAASRERKYSARQ
jgi:hypothetical protein